MKPGSVSFRAANEVLNKCISSGAQDWTRTSTPVKALPPQSSMSTNFTTWANYVHTGAEALASAPERVKLLRATKVATFIDLTKLYKKRLTQIPAASANIPATTLIEM